MRSKFVSCPEAYRFCIGSVGVKLALEIAEFCGICLCCGSLVLDCIDAFGATREPVPNVGPNWGLCSGSVIEWADQRFLYKLAQEKTVFLPSNWSSRKVEKVLRFW
jgi:hypothetical protein